MQELLTCAKQDCYLEFALSSPPYWALSSQRLRAIACPRGKIPSGRHFV